MDMVTFAKHFVNLELPSCALSCLLLIPKSSVKEKHISSLLSSDCHLTILDQLRELRMQGKTVPFADQVMLLNYFRKSNYRVATRLGIGAHFFRQKQRDSDKHSSFNLLL